jgi:arylsulfatase
VRDGKWKLAWARQGPWELFDMDADRTEMYDLADQMPRRLSDMKRAWETWARSHGVQFQTSFSYYNMINDYVKHRNMELESSH